MSAQRIFSAKGMYLPVPSPRTLFFSLRHCLKPVHSVLAVFFLLSVCPTHSSSQSRYRLAASPDAWLAPLAVTGAVGAFFLYQSTPGLSLEDLISLNTRDISSIDRWATSYSSLTVRRASDITLGVSLLLPLLVLTEFDEDYLHLAGMYAETIALTWSITNFVKASGRIRPLAYNPDAALSERQSSEMRQSFLSGHASVSMAAMVFLATVYETYRPGTTMSRTLWIGGIGLGMATSAARVFSGMHFPTDVLAGMLLGGAIGYVVPKLHETNTGANIRASLGPNSTPILHLSISL